MSETINHLNKVLKAASDLCLNNVDCVVIATFDGVGDSYKSASCTSNPYHFVNGGDVSIQQRINAGDSLDHCEIEYI